MEEGFQKPCGTTSFCAGSGWRATRRTGRGGGRGRVGEREGVGAAVAEEVGVEARGHAADVDPSARAGVRPVGAGAGGGGDVEEEEEEQREGIGHFGEWPTEGESRGGGRVTEATGFVDVDGGGADFTVLVKSRYLGSCYLS